MFSNILYIHEYYLSPYFDSIIRCFVSFFSPWLRCLLPYLGGRFCVCTQRKCVTLCGTIFGLPNVSGVPIYYTVNGEPGITFTNNEGEYFLTVPVCSNVIITPANIPGFIASPLDYFLPHVTNHAACLDFVYSAITVNVTLSGTVSGLPNNSGVTVNYSINGIPDTTLTDAGGHFSILVPIGASVVITPSEVEGFTVEPPEYVITDVSADISNLDFLYNAVTVFFLERATSVLPAYSSAPNAWPLHGSILPDLYMVDRILITLPPSPPVVVKWAYGIQDINYFVEGGGFDITNTYQQGIPANLNTSYTVYVRLSNGFEEVASILIDRVRDGSVDMPYLLIDYPTALALEPDIPGIGQFTLDFMQGGGDKLIANYELYENIDMSGRAWEPIGVTNSNFPYTIIEAFTGSLDGNENEILNLVLGETSATDNQGFFRALSDGATIQNLGLVNWYVSSEEASAGLAAVANVLEGGTILLENLTFSGSINTFAFAAAIISFSNNNNGTIIINRCSVSASINCNDIGGGIVGYGFVSSGGELTVSNCYTAGSVEVSGDSAAGIVAFCSSSLAAVGAVFTITNCANNMTISSAYDRSAGILGGAVVACNITISSCYNGGDATCNESAGGICGSFNSIYGSRLTIDNCYNSGTISARITRAGGIMGYFFANCFLRNSYSTGSVAILTLIPTSGSQAVGGISSTWGVIQNCAAICELVNGMDSATARISPLMAALGPNELNNNLAFDGMQVLINGVPKSPLDTGSSGVDGISASAGELTTQATYESTLGWDFTNVWSFGNGAYKLPILRGIPASLQPTELPPFL